ncbi:MAG: hypothetical protein JHD00_03845 [Akkermansiaceae bacterium]|nr:hypothetical protein [Akkermansiaceae bacterium]
MKTNSDVACISRSANLSPMRFYLFLVGLTILATGGAAPYLMNHVDALGYVTGALQLGGGILICGLFSLKMPWHGIIGAGVLALLGAARGIGNLPGLAKFVTGNRPHGFTPVMELGVTLLCTLLLVKITRALFQERTRRMLESAE